MVKSFIGAIMFNQFYDDDKDAALKYSEMSAESTSRWCRFIRCGTTQVTFVSIIMIIQWFIIMMRMMEKRIGRIVLQLKGVLHFHHIWWQNR